MEQGALSHHINLREMKMILKSLTAGIAMSILLSTSAMAEDNDTLANTQDAVMVTEESTVIIETQDAMQAMLVADSSDAGFMALKEDRTTTDQAVVDNWIAAGGFAAFVAGIWILSDGNNDSNDVPTSP